MTIVTTKSTFALWEPSFLTEDASTSYSSHFLKGSLNFSQVLILGMADFMTPESRLSTICQPNQEPYPILLIYDEKLLIEI